MSDAKGPQQIYVPFGTASEIKGMKEMHPLKFSFTAEQLQRMSMSLNYTPLLLKAYAQITGTNINVTYEKHHDNSKTLAIELTDKSANKPQRLKNWLMGFSDVFEIFYRATMHSESTRQLAAVLKIDPNNLLLMSANSKLILAFKDEKTRDAAAKSLYISGPCKQTEAASKLEIPAACLPNTSVFTIGTCGYTHTHFILTIIPPGLTVEKYVRSMIELLDQSQYEKQQKSSAPTIPEGYVADTEYRYPEDIAKSHPELKLSVLKH